ncbi:nucleotide-binding protein [Ruegeria hyattellae]|uniref:nucleotide-binding protein n=1 Tax=Ruegeria hyattellae TaxID=3233337 RepID=UPI00355BE09A
MPHLFNLLVAIGVALFLATTAVADTISPKETSQYVGAQATVVGVVSQVSTSSGGTTFINFGGRYPNHVFYAVIFKKHASKFQNVHSLKGKAVAIAGPIELYKGKPQIIVSSPGQIALR